MSDEEAAGLKRGPKPKGEIPMTGAERNRLYRQRKKRRAAEEKGQLPTALEVLSSAVLWNIELADSMLASARKTIETGADRRIALHSLTRFAETLEQIRVSVSEVRAGKFPTYSGAAPGTDKRFQKP